MAEIDKLIKILLDETNHTIQNVCRFNLAFEHTYDINNCRSYKEFIEKVKDDGEENFLEEECHIDSMVDPSVPIRKLNFTIFARNTENGEIMAVVNCGIYYLSVIVGKLDSFTRGKYSSLGLNKVLRVLAYRLLVNGLRCQYLITVAVNKATIHIVTKYFKWESVSAAEDYPLTTNQRKIKIAEETMSTGDIVNFVGDYSEPLTAENIQLNLMYNELLACSHYKGKRNQETGGKVCSVM